MTEHPIRRKLRQIFYRVFGFEVASNLRLYSPFSLTQALILRSRYGKYRAMAAKNFNHPRVPFDDIGQKGVVALNATSVITEHDVRKVHEAFRTPEACLSFKAGFFHEGIDESAEYVYLKSPVLNSLSLPQKVIGMEALRKLEAHLGCHMRLVHFVCYKTFPNGFVDRGSFLWHRDGQPDDSYKIILYLTDVGPQDGPFSYVPGTHREYSGLPQFGNTRPPSAQNQPTAIEFQGRVGDGVLFNVNGMHRGGRSTANARIVIAANFKPSKIPSAEHLERYGFANVPFPEHGTDPDRVWWIGQ